MTTIDVRYTMTAPLSHIGETASTGAYFNMIKTSNGRIPVITGNSIRGQIRDAGANELLDRLDTKVDKEVFHVLFSGGNVSATMKDDVGRATAVREHFPLISVLGGALSTMIMSGKLYCGFAYPECIETESMLNIKSTVSWHDMIDEIEFTRTDDAKNDKMAARITNTDAESTGQASQQMRYSVQYIAPYTSLQQRLLLLPGTTEVEIGAILSAIEYWWRNTPRLGGMGSKGFGMFDAVARMYDNDAIKVVDGHVTVSNDAMRLIEAYRSQTMDSGMYFDLLKGAKESGKKANKSN